MLLAVNSEIAFETRCLTTSSHMVKLSVFLNKMVHATILSYFILLIQKQKFNTKGASDVKFFSQNSQNFLLFVNSLDDTSNSDLTLDIYIWDAGLGRFSSTTWQAITSLYPRAVDTFHIGNVLFLAVANYYDWTTSAYETR